ncbi:MAG: hypothetical protein IKY50_05970, partial [Alistipes sp.]|nr:hypothetical protein [Alistipes sp.]
MKYLSILLALLFVVACEPAADNPDTPTPPNVEIPEDENGEENGENGEDNGEEDNSWMDEVPLGSLRNKGWNCHFRYDDCLPSACRSDPKT